MKKRRPRHKIDILLGLLLLFISVILLIKGEINLPRHDVFMDGAQARVMACLVLLFALWCLFGSKTHEKLKDQDEK